MNSYKSIKEHPPWSIFLLDLLSSHIAESVKMLLKSLLLTLAISLPSLVSSQLAGSGYQIGPLTTSDAKWAVKVCDVTKYGAVADGTTDIGPPLLAAFNACKTGGIGESTQSRRCFESDIVFVVNIPSGTYAMATWVTLSGGSAWGINLEGVIERTGYVLCRNC